MPPLPPSPIWRTSVMCSGAMQRNKAPYWVHRTWVNVRLEHMQQETEKKGGAQRRGEKRLREAEVGGR